MKYLFILLLSIPAWTAFSFECQPVQNIEWKKLAAGVEWVQYDLSFTPYLKNETRWSNEMARSVTVRAFKIDMNQAKLLFHRRSKTLNCNPSQERMIEQLLIDQNRQALGAINANFYVMPDGDVLGLAIDEEKKWSHNLNNLKRQSQGFFRIDRTGSELLNLEQYLERANQPAEFVVQAYPKLLTEQNLNVTDEVLDSKRSRTSIGSDVNSNSILLVTIDAGGENMKTGMTLFEYAYMLKNQSCGVPHQSALNLDGGGSTAFAVPSAKLYKQADRCRNLGNILTIHSR
jgi:exopolysaccharide biosynthesis protein